MSAPIHVPDVASLNEFEGVELGPSAWLTITQEQIDDFAEATGDRQWIHIDVERAERESPFGSTVAHGYLTVSLASVILPELILVEKYSQIINYGIDKLRFREPVPAGARMRIAGTLQHVRNIAGGAARVTRALRWEVDGARRPVCQAELVYVYYS